MTPGPIVSRWNDLFIYDETSSSCLRWRVSRRRVKVGDVAGYLRRDGYYEVKVAGRKVQVHRVIFERQVGEIPAGIEIDHIDRNRANNRIANLRLVTHLQNARNRHDNTPHPGVYRRRHGWLVHVRFADGVACKCFYDYALAVEQAEIWHRLADENPNATVAMAKAMK